ncbi:GDSL esterase/lipase [Rhynchospora pubera]|uniref:GDSL esterase/lipase n=1 Tax=Rhynchospora pubera TaxID=906938 RepID=A0AAV8HMU4_9POAL|nr:GDSL esterase/lipase [Rhynchospora pubera]
MAASIVFPSFDYFHHPTGGWSDGRLLLDFIAEDIGLPFVPPYLGSNSIGYFRHGANFAVGGATALNHSIFHEMGVPVETRAGFLAIQVQWFKELLTLLCLESGTLLCPISALSASTYSLPVNVVTFKITWSVDWFAAESIFSV